MESKKVTVSECIEGDILASDVINANGVILVAKDTVVNDYIKEKLMDLGIVSVHIYNPSCSSSKDSAPYRKFVRNYKETILQTKNMLHDLTAGRTLDYKKVCCISDQISTNVNQNDNIIMYLSQIRNADEYTYTHCVNTAIYSMLIARWLRMQDNEVDRIIKSGLMHDIGKTQIPVAVLNKKGSLTQEEYETIKKHTILGYKLVENAGNISNDIKRVILFHHERIDGSGYPFKLERNSIDLYSRIIAVADVFDAMTSDRVYRKRVTPFEVFEMFETIGTNMFDGSVLRVFINKLAAYLIGSSVSLSNGETGEIVYIPLQNKTCPIIRVSSGYLKLSKENTIRIVSMI